MINTVIFDLGGVIITLDPSQAAQRFTQLGLTNAEQYLDSYTQQGIFGALESGQISADVFQQEFSKLAGRATSWSECAYAWQGYAKEVPQRNLDMLINLRHEGYRLLLLSNTNPFMMEWVRSSRFDGHGHSVDYYFDKLYLSYEMKVMKPSAEIFAKMLMDEQLSPSSCLFVDDGPRNVATASQMGMRTFCPKNGADWTTEIYKYLV